MRTFVIWSVHFRTCRSGPYPRSVTVDSGTSCGAASFRSSFLGQFSTMAYTTVLAVLLLPLFVYLSMESFVYVFECGCWSDTDKTSMIILSVDRCLLYSIQYTQCSRIWLYACFHVISCIICWYFLWLSFYISVTAQDQTWILLNVKYTC